MHDFEIHIGFPTSAAEEFERLGNETGRKWKTSTVAEVVAGSIGRGMLDPHDVPGELLGLATMRCTNLADALVLGDELAAKYQAVPDIRIEIEQVLLTQPPGSERHFESPIGYVACQDDFPHGELIRDTPSFEAHFGIQTKDGAPIPQSTAALVELAERQGIPVHQAVRFKSKEKVVLTTFFQNNEEMTEWSGIYADKLLGALASEYKQLQLKLVAERIVLCLKPGHG